MSKAKPNATLDKIYDFFTQRIVYHSLGWAMYLLIFTLIQGSEGNYSLVFSNEVVKVIFYAIGVYFNTTYLIPNYLSQKKFLRYCGLLILSVLMITPIQVFVLVMKAGDYPQIQEYIKNNQTWLYMMMFLVISTTTVLKIISEWVRNQREMRDLETQTMQSELRFLKSQINPHFLFNTLNNLYALTLKKSDDAPEIVLKLSEMMRYMLYECNEKWVMLSREVQYLKNYLDLERLRQGKNGEINFEINGNITNQRIAPLMFIPFVENSFKHGLNNNLQDGYVNIYLEVNDLEMQVIIANSKPGIPNQFHKRSGGIGLVNVRRRLNILYPDQYELNITDSPDEYQVELTLKLSVGG